MKRKQIVDAIKAVVVGDNSAAWQAWLEGPSADQWLSQEVDALADLMPETIAGKLHLYAYGPLGGFFSIETADVISALRGNAKDVVLHIDSPGGRLATGFAIANYLRRQTYNVTALVDGLAASAATIVAAGCNERIMAAGSRWMIHKSRVLGVMTADDAGEWQERLNQSDQDMAGEYARIGNRDVAAYLVDMKAERFFTPAEAESEGFAVMEGLDTPESRGQTRQNIANSANEGPMTPEEQARFDAVQAENTRLKAAAEASETTSALADAAAQVTAAQTAQKAAEDERDRIKAEADAKLVDARVATYPESLQALAKAAINSGDEAAVKALDAQVQATAVQANESTQSQADPLIVATNGAQGVEGAAAAAGTGEPQARYDALVAQAAQTLGCTDREARKHVRGSAAGRKILGEIADLRAAGKANTVHRIDAA